MRSKPSSIKKSSAFDLHSIRNDFPIFRTRVNGKPLIYLDNAATSLTPRSVVEALREYYLDYKANVHRGIHTLSEKATEHYEGARQTLANLINAPSTRNIIFTRNATEAINLIAYAWGQHNVNDGDEVLLTIMEHHSNLVPWQQLAKQRGATLHYVDIDETGNLLVDELENLLSEKTKLLAITHMSNMLGTINPIRRLTALAHANGTLVCVDGAQSVPHFPVDVQDLDCDFMAFSGHKMLGPTGVGVLYGKESVLDEMMPFNYGGEMILSVGRSDSVWNELPHKFEAGTPCIAEAIGLAAAADYLQGVGWDRLQSQEADLIEYTIRRLGEIEDLELYGPRTNRGSAITFNVGTIHPHDLSTFLDQEGIAIRAGHHCAQPLHERLGPVATARASLYFYNTREEIDVLVEGIQKARAFFTR